MQIVLATPPADGDTWGIGSFPTLGLAYLASSVTSIPGMNVTVVDGLAEGLDLAEATERVLSVNPDMLGVTVTSMTIERGLKLIKSVKECRPDVVTIVGGHHATVFDSLLLNEVRELDFVLRGEGEESFPELCARLTRSEDVSGVKGLSYRADGKVIRGVPQAVSDLDSIAFPDREVFTYKGYGTQWGGLFHPTGLFRGTSHHGDFPWMPVSVHFLREDLTPVGPISCQERGERVPGGARACRRGVQCRWLRGRKFQLRREENHQALQDDPGR